MSTTTAPSQGEASTAADVSHVAGDRPRPSASRRRDKPQLSCNHCRRRNEVCTYPFQGFADDTALRQQQPLPVALSLRDRLDQLESLVVSLRSELIAKGTEGQTQSALPQPSLSDTTSPAVAAGACANTSNYDMPIDESSEYGSICISSSKLHYVGGEHWAAILDGIAEMRGQVVGQEDKGSYDLSDLGEATSEPSPRALLLYGNHRKVSRAEILEALPPKAAVDRYISRYFNRLDLVSCAVHGPTFLREYEAFWENSDGVPIAWLGLLFSMLCLAVMASDAHDSGYSSEADHQSFQIDLYREKIVQCLIMSEYTKPSPSVLEAVIHYLYVEFLLGPDAQDDLWFLLALEVNMAMRMGYHRDPSHFPEIPPLQAEMRRRLWSTVLLGDILISSQMGMPRMISDSGCDTAEPRNFNDTDLSPDMTELPSPRPETEMTTVLGLIARRRISMALGTISDLTARAKPYSYAEVMRVDSVLRDAEASVPPPLKMKPLAVSMTDPPITIMARMFLKHLFYKGQLMLHRRPIQMKTPLHVEDAFAYSRRACLDASLQLLQIQQILDEETRPGGQLDIMRWRMTSSMNHQFLTATVMLCSLVHREQTQGRFEEIMAALRGARSIWMRSADSQEAKKAVDTLNITLARANNGNTAVVAKKGIQEDSGGNGLNNVHAMPYNRNFLDIDGSSTDLGQFMLQESEPEGLMIESLFPTIWQTEQFQTNDFTFNFNVWGSDYTALDDLRPPDRPGGIDS
ncbi:fungal-specific transcription factor domain-containing protein [Xylaria sp. FL1777]|nr:fungal-specific transcription factor domain-containing protein [Xylaria sp. FL1777]